MLYGDLNTITIGDKTYQGFKVNIAYPEKTAVVRLPTNDEMVEWLNAYAGSQKSKVKKTETQMRAPDLELFKKIRLDDGEAFDEFEAEYVVTKITSCNTISCERTGDAFTVRMKTPFSEVVHVMRALMLKELATYRSAINRGVLDWCGNSVLSLHTSVLRKTEGYKDGIDIPPHHKNLAMSEMAMALFEVDPLVVDPS